MLFRFNQQDEITFIFYVLSYGRNGRVRFRPNRAFRVASRTAFPPTNWSTNRTRYSGGSCQKAGWREKPRFGRSLTLPSRGTSQMASSFIKLADQLTKRNSWEIASKAGWREKPRLRTAPHKSVVRVDHMRGHRNRGRKMLEPVERP
jgi:hypothetical protein